MTQQPISTAPPDVDTSFSNLWIKFPRIWEDFIDVAWSRQLFDGRKVLKFQLAASGENYRVERYFGPDEHAFRLLGLVPDMTVEVRVRVLVESPATGPTWCAWATSVATTMTAANTLVGHISSDSIHGRITWGGDLIRTGPTATHVAAAPEKYQVKVRQKGRVLSNDICEREVSAKFNEFLIDMLDANSVFEVQIRAISVYGDVGRWCLPVRFLTLAPVEVQVAELGEDYAICRWQRSRWENFDTAEGCIEELIIAVELLPSQRELDVDPQAKRVQVDAKTFSNETRLYRIKDLIPGRKYVVRSRYRNVLGDWTEWTTALFKTLNPVSSPDVQLVGHNFVQVHWQREEDDESSGFVEGAAKDVDVWEVRCATGSAKTSMELAAKEVETKLVNLQPGVDYSIDVRARTKAGEWGPWSVPVTVTTLHRLQPRVEVSGETWLKVAWDRKEKRYRDNITRYHLQLNCSNSPFRLTKYFPSTTTAYTFDNLKPGTKYYLVMQAFSDQRWGPWSEPVEVSTCAPCIAQLSRRGEDFIQVRWRSDYYERNAVENLDQMYQIRLRRPEPNDDGSETQTAAPTLLKEDQVNQNHYRVQHLGPFSRVILQIRCFDYMLQTWCEWGPESEFRTLPSAVVKTHVGETFVDVSWSRAPRILSAISDQDMDAGIEDPLFPDNALQYILRLNKVDDSGQHREAAKFHFDQAHSTTFTVSDLLPDHVYSLQLSFLDAAKRWSPESAPIKFRTLPRLRVVVLDVGEGYCTLQWGRWSNGIELPMKECSAYKIVLEDVAAEDGIPIQFHVQDRTVYTVPNLTPNMLYRVQVAASPKGTTNAEWGVWSEALYVCTTAPMEADLELVGEDYAQLSWKRLPRDNLLAKLQDPKICVVSWDAKSQRGPPAADLTAVRDGNCVYVGEDAVQEYHVKLFCLRESGVPGESERQLQFESKLSRQHTSVRIPGLTANTEYEGYICAAGPSHEWGVWSNALRFKTSMPTEVRVGQITQDAVTVVWNKGGDERVDENVLRYQLRIQGIDDEYLLEVELPADQHSFDVKGLNINSCYAVAVRSFLKNEMEWTPFCHKIYIVLKVIAVEVLETSQDWAHLEWVNKVAPDNRPKVQFLTLLGDGTATTVTLGAAARSYIFPNLSASSLYTAHLLSVEETGSYVKVPPSRSQHNYSRSVSTTSSATNFSIPLVAADFSMYLADGHVFRTHRALELSLERVGQNFVLIKWSAQESAHSEGENDGHQNDQLNSLSSELFEVEVVDIDSDEKEPKLLRTQGNFMFVRGLAPASNVRCSVRWVAKHSDAVCKWSAPIVARLLPMIEPVLGSGDGTETPGVGEDYLLIHWDASIRNSNFESDNSLSFEVRLLPLEGPEAHREQIFEVKGNGSSSHHFQNLQPDTKYQIQIRTVIAHQGVVTETIRGEWSRSLICTTLSPMAVAVTDVVEVGAVVHWRRKNCAVGDGWWENVDPELIRSEILTISSFHVRATTVPAAGETGEPVTVFDEQFGERHTEYAACWAKLRGLKPGGTYAVSVRASTGMLWGAWSTPVQFRTQVPVRVDVPSIGDCWVAVRWRRDESSQETSLSVNGAIAKSGSILQWEVSLCTVGAEKEKTKVAVNRAEWNHCVGSLQCNRPYTVCVRPVYKDDEYGPWSIPLYFVTLAPLKVDVGKVGETFVQVSWEREPQRTIASMMRYKHLDAVKALDAELREYEEQLAELRNTDGDESAVSLNDLTGTNPKPSSSRPSATKEETERYLVEQIESARQRSEKEKKLLSLQIAELEREAVYPKGDDMKFELVVHGGNSEGDQNVPFLYKKKLTKDELVCRLENLQPKSLYKVTVRACFAGNPDFDPTGMNSSNVADMDSDFGVPWGGWSEWVTFVTLKPISISTNGVGSECISVMWDTGLTGNSSSRTAITRFQIHLLRKGVPAAEQLPDLTLEDPSLKGHVVAALIPNSQYSVAVRVCYEGDKWGVWSNSIQFMTMPKLLSKLESVAERQIELLVWRDAQIIPNDPQVVVWNPLVTEHQLAINGQLCSHTFSLEQGTSTLLTLDTLAVDTEYTISARDKVVDYWQNLQSILESETIPFAPLKPTLQQRKGTHVVIAWKHKQNLSSRQYVYMVEMALVTETRIGPKTTFQEIRREPGAFSSLGFTLAQDFQMELPYAIHDCYFRVKVCKTNQTIDGEPHPITANVSSPQSITVDNPHVYVWSTSSPAANFKTPSLPDHPTHIHVTNLTHCSATLRWEPPANANEHCEILYRVFLNNNYLDQFTCVYETDKTHAPLRDLIPNCHYRVSVTAESTMGRSTQNNTLHFSTPFPSESPAGAPKRKVIAGRRLDIPLTSTLPPRSKLTIPKMLRQTIAPPQPAADDMSVLLDERASTALSAGIRVTSKPGGRRSPSRGTSPDARASSAPLLKE